MAFELVLFPGLSRSGLFHALVVPHRHLGQNVRMTHSGCTVASIAACAPSTDREWRHEGRIWIDISICVPLPLLVPIGLLC